MFKPAVGWLRFSMKAVLTTSLIWNFGCGYRPVAGRLAAAAPSGIKFAPFVVRNLTDEALLTHVLSDALLISLGRLGLLARGGDAGAYRIECTLLSISEGPASFAPDRATVIDYVGFLTLAYTVSPMAATLPIVSGVARINYRYDFSESPQFMREFRYGAMANAVQAWLPKLLWQTAVALDEGRAHVFAAAVSDAPLPEHPAAQEHPMWKIGP